MDRFPRIEGGLYDCHKSFISIILRCSLMKQAHDLEECLFPAQKLLFQDLIRPELPLNLQPESILMYILTPKQVKFTPNSSQEPPKLVDLDQAARWRKFHWQVRNKHMRYLPSISSSDHSLTHEVPSISRSDHSLTCFQNAKLKLVSKEMAHQESRQLGRQFEPGSRGQPRAKRR